MVSEPAPAASASASRDRDPLARLEELVRSLAERYEKLSAQYGVLREQLTERDARLKSLEESQISQHQLCLDAAKRIDDLVALIDLLDAQLEARERNLPSAAD